MSESKTYQERVQENKISLSKSIFKTVWDFAILNGESGESLEIGAKNSVAAQAEAIRQFVNNTYYAPETIAVKKFIDTYLLDHGYVEPKNNEDESINNKRV